MMSENDVNIRLGEALRDGRMRAEMTQQQTAWACGIDRSTVQRIEAGRPHRSFATIVRMCAVLDLDVNEVGAHATGSGASGSGAS